MGRVVAAPGGAGLGGRADDDLRVRSRSRRALRSSPSSARERNSNGIARRNCVVAEHPDGLKGKLIQILSQTLEFFQNIVVGHPMPLKVLGNDNEKNRQRNEVDGRLA